MIMKVLTKENIGNGIEKVRVATAFARGVDLKSGLYTRIATETKMMYMHHNKVFNLRNQCFLFASKEEAKEQLDYINQLYDFCKTANTAVLYFSDENAQATTTVCIDYTENNCVKSAMVTYDISTGKIVEIKDAGYWSVIGIQGCKPYRRLTINKQQTPNKRRLTIADALSRRA
jgi:hypothetical protein